MNVKATSEQTSGSSDSINQLHLRAFTKLLINDNVLQLTTRAHRSHTVHTLLLQGAGGDSDLQGALLRGRCETLKRN
jgi:hypothetical protein